MVKFTITWNGETLNSMPNQIQDDYGFDISFNLFDNVGEAFNLTDKSAFFKARPIGESTPFIDQQLTVTTSTSGIGVYTVTQGDLQTSGVWLSEIEITSGTSIQSVQLGRFSILEDI